MGALGEGTQGTSLGMLSWGIPGTFHRDQAPQLEGRTWLCGTTGSPEVTAGGTASGERSSGRQFALVHDRRGQGLGKLLHAGGRRKRVKAAKRNSRELKENLKSRGVKTKREEAFRKTETSTGK